MGPKDNVTTRIPVKITVHKWKDVATPMTLLEVLGNQDVQVWLAEVPGCAAEIAVDVLLLNEPERQRAERFLVTAARNEFVFGRALLRRLLGACLDVDPAGVAIDYGERGKPRLAGGAASIDLHFNLAHSHSLVAIALARGREVGVDIEWMDPALDWSLIAERVFSASELGGMRCLPASLQRLAFFNGWTRKEAYLKATGEGLIDELSGIEVTIAPDEPARLLRLAAASMGSRLLEIHEIPVPEGFCGALVVANPCS